MSAKEKEKRKENGKLKKKSAKMSEWKKFNKKYKWVLKKKIKIIEWKSEWKKRRSWNRKKKLSLSLEKTMFMGSFFYNYPWFSFSKEKGGLALISLCITFFERVFFDKRRKIRSYVAFMSVM